MTLSDLWSKLIGWFKRWFQIGEQTFVCGSADAPSVIRDRLLSHGQREEDGVVHYKSSGIQLWDTKYKWRIKPHPGRSRYAVHEKIYVSAKTLLFLSCMAFLVGISFSYVILYLISNAIGYQFVEQTELMLPNEIIAAAVYLFATGLSYILFVYQSRISKLNGSPLIGEYTEDFESKTQFRITANMIVLFVISATIGMLLGLNYVILPAFAWVAYFVSPHTWNERFLDIWQTFPSVPSVNQSYISLSLSYLVFVGVYVVLMNNLQIVLAIEKVPILSTILILALSSMTGLVYASMYSQAKEFEVTRRMVVTSGAKVTNPLRVLFYGTIVIAMAIGLIWALIAWVDTVRWHMTFVELTSIYIISAIVGFGFLYLIVGALYQWARFGVRLLRLYRFSEPYDHAYENVEVPVRLVNTDKIAGYAIATPWDNYAVISKGILRLQEEGELSAEEVEALLLHEQGHIKYRDTHISTLVAIFSPLLLIGKNIIFSLVNFRSREVRADRYAAEQLGSTKPIDGAIETIARKKAEEQTSRRAEVPSITSGIQSEEKPSLDERIFGIFYGGFAISKIHPSPQERRAYLKEI